MFTFPYCDLQSHSSTFIRLDDLAEPLGFGALEYKLESCAFTILDKFKYRKSQREMAYK
jgi:hypothetical protein